METKGRPDGRLIGPGTPRSDLAFVAWHRVPLQHPTIARGLLNRDGMLHEAAEGVAAYVRLVQDGRVAGMNAAIAFLEETGGYLQAQLS
jgi:hypothetical protein